MTKPEREELAKAKATISACWKTANDSNPTDDDLVDGLIRVVRLAVDRGKSDERLALSALQTGVGLSTTDASRAWDCLSQTNVEWMQSKSGANRDGICRHLKVIGIEIDSNAKAAVRWASRWLLPPQAHPMALLNNC